MPKPIVQQAFSPEQGVLSLTNRRTGPALEKPAYWIDGNSHAGEVTGSTVVLYYLPELCAQHSRFTLAHAALCPYLSVRTVQVEARGAEVFHIALVVQNNGFLPTYTSKKALERQCVRPIEVVLALPEGVTLVSGQLRQEIGHLEGRANKIWAPGTGSSPTDHLCQITWVVQGPRGTKVDVTVRSQRAGVVRRRLGVETCSS